MPYDKQTDSHMSTEDYKALKAERRAANKLAHKEARVPAKKPIGTAKGNNQRIAEFKERLLAAPVGETMIRKIIEIAKDDEHPGQMTALKMAIDRILPLSLFEKDKDGGTRTAIQINITGLDGSGGAVFEQDTKIDDW